MSNGLKVPGGFGQKTTMTIAPSAIRVTDKDVYIHPKLKEDLEELVCCMERGDLFGTEMGYSGILFTGPPGTGKTIYAQWLASKTNGILYEVDVVAGPDHIKQIYNQLREQKLKDSTPIILFLDEVDRYSNRDDIVDPNQASTLNQLLKEMNGTALNKGIYVIGSTNKQEKIDNALRRPGRFDKEIEFVPPDQNGRLEILKIHAYNKDHKFKVEEKDLVDISKVTYGYTGADLKGVLKEAFARANKDKRTKVTFDDLNRAFKRIKPSALRDMPFKEPSIKLDDMCGYDLHKEVLRRIIEAPSEDLLLFYGPDGNGKTTAAEAIAGEYGYNLIVVNASAPLDKFLGETDKLIVKYVDRSKHLAPSVLVFDKVDALVKQEGIMSYKDSWTGLLESKLSRPIEGVTVVATVCDPGNLTDTFKGLFTHKICFNNPTKEDRAKLWKKYIGNEDVDIEKLVENSEGLSCRDIVQICKKIHDFQLPQTDDVYMYILNNHQPTSNGINYDDLKKELGDSVMVYESVKPIIKSKEDKDATTSTKEKKDSKKNPTK